MFDHVSIGVSDVARTRKFYDAALKPLGYTLLSDGESSLGYGGKAVGLWISASKSPVKANTESGLHFCFVAPDRKAVDAFHAGALKAGGKDNGKPGVRAGASDRVSFRASTSRAAGDFSEACASNRRWISSRTSMARSNSRRAGGLASFRPSLAVVQAARSSGAFSVSVGVSCPRQ